MEGETPPKSLSGHRTDGGQVAWSVLLNSFPIAAIVVGAIRIVAMVRGFVEHLQPVREGGESKPPAVLLHDYGGTLLVIGFLFVFWIFVQRWILGLAPSDELEVRV